VTPALAAEAKAKVQEAVKEVEEESKMLEECFAFRAITWSWVPAQTLMILYLAHFVSAGWASMSWAEFIGVALVSGSMCGAIGITIAHELIHKQNAFEQNLGKALLLGTSYQHFYIEHLLGHHRRVGTREDPATSRFGESLYAFIPRSVVGSYASAWRLESVRLAKKDLPFWSLRHNQMLQFTLASACVFAAFFLWGGAPALAFFLLQSVVAFSMLEIVNYFEHYGLERRELGRPGSGRYELVTPLHSWNADHRVTNYLSFKLQRHSDHHTWPFRRYQTLRSWDFSPQLPLGYIGMILLSLCTPLFRYIMDPKVRQYNLIQSAPEFDSSLLSDKAE
jgi:alkane 1-monooxygenase